MKKLLLLSIVMLIGTSFSFAQYQVKVIWDASDPNCSCGVSIEGVFQINLTIYDVANDESLDPYYTTANGSEYEKIIDVDEVEDYCNEQHEYTPSFTIRATVLLHCNANPPFDACDGSGQTTTVTCNNFSSLTPVEVDAGELD